MKVSKFFKKLVFIILNGLNWVNVIFFCYIIDLGVEFICFGGWGGVGENFIFFNLFV